MKEIRKPSGDSRTTIIATMTNNVMAMVSYLPIELKQEVITNVIKALTDMQGIKVA